MDYELNANLLSASDTFQFTLPVPTLVPAERRELFAMLEEGAEVKVYVGKGRARSLQLTGYIDQRFIDAGENGTTVTISGYDLGQHLAKSHSPPRFGVTEHEARKVVVTRNLLETPLVEPDAAAEVGINPFVETYTKVTNVAAQGKTFADVVAALVQPWDIEVVTDPSAARDLLTGRARKGDRDRLQQERARSLGIPRQSYQRDAVDRARSAGKPIDELLGVETSDASRRDFANGLTSSDIQRLKISEAKPQFGETIWAFVTRHASRLGLLAWMSPDGKLVLSSPNYGSRPLFRLVRRLRQRDGDLNTIKRGGFRSGIGERVSSVHVYGRQGANKPTRSKFKANAVEHEIPFYRPIHLHDNTIRDSEEAQRRADREITLRQAQSLELDYTVPDHGQGDLLYSVDTLYSIEDEALGIRGELWYCVGRTFVKTRGGSGSLPTETRLRLRPRGSIAL